MVQTPATSIPSWAIIVIIVGSVVMVLAIALITVFTVLKCKRRQSKARSGSTTKSTMPIITEIKGSDAFDGLDNLPDREILASERPR